MGFERRYLPLKRATSSSVALNDVTDVTITSATTGDLLRFDGAAWVNYPDSNYAAASHTHAEADITDGALLARLADTETITGAWTFDNNVVIDNGNYLRIYDSTTTDYIQLAHDGADGHIFTNQGNLHLSAALGTVAIGTPAGVGEQFHLESGSIQYFWNSANTFQMNIAHDGGALNITGNNSHFVDLHGGIGLRVYDSLNTDYLEVLHDGTQALISTDATSGGSIWFTAQGGAGDVFLSSGTDLVIRDAGALRVQDATDTDSIDLTMSTSQATFTSTQHILFTPASGHEVYVFRSGESIPFRVYDGTGADYIQMSHDGSVGHLLCNTGNLELTPGSGSGNVVYVYKGGAAADFRVYDGSGGDYASFSHDGTDFNTTFNTTTDWNISGITNLDLTAALKVRKTGSHIYIYETDAVDPNDYYLFDANSGNLNDYFWDDSAAAFKLLIRRDGVNQRLHLCGDTIGYFQAVSGNYGSVQVAGAEGSSGGYSGYSIAGRLVFMENGSNTGGIYDDVNNEWKLRTDINNGAIVGYYNGATVFQTVAASSGGLQANNTSTGAGFERVLTTSDLGGGGLDTKVKTATTSRSSTTTFSADPHLASWSLTAGQKYGMIGHLTYIAANTTPDIKFDWVWTNAPADAGDWGLLQTDDAKVLQEADSESPMTTAMVALDIASREQTAWVHGHFEANASTGGTVSLHWAQNTSSATATQLLLGSWIALIDLGA